MNSTTSRKTRLLLLVVLVSRCLHAGETNDYSLTNNFKESDKKFYNSVAWGAFSSNISAGITFAHRYQDKAHPKAPCCVLYATTNRKNDYRTPVLPKEDYLFDLTLRDEAGQTVKKTSLGNSFGKGIPDGKIIANRVDSIYLRQWKRFGLIPNVPRQVYVIKNLSQFFKVEKSGDYTLQAEVRIYIPTNSTDKNSLAPVTLKTGNIHVHLDPDNE